MIQSPFLFPTIYIELMLYVNGEMAIRNGGKGRREGPLIVDRKMKKTLEPHQKLDGV